MSYPLMHTRYSHRCRTGDSLSDGLVSYAVHLLWVGLTLCRNTVGVFSCHSLDVSEEKKRGKEIEKKKWK